MQNNILLNISIIYTCSISFSNVFFRLKLYNELFKSSDCDSKYVMKIVVITEEVD